MECRVCAHMDREKIDASIRDRGVASTKREWPAFGVASLRKHRSTCLGLKPHALGWPAGVKRPPRRKPAGPESASACTPVGATGNVREKERRAPSAEREAQPKREPPAVPSSCAACLHEDRDEIDLALRDEGVRAAATEWPALGVKILAGHLRGCLGLDPKDLERAKPKAPKVKPEPAPVPDLASVPDLDPSPSPLPEPSPEPRPEPHELFALVVRANAATIADVAGSAEEGTWVGIDVADPFVEAVDGTDLVEVLPREAQRPLADLSGEPSAVRLCARWRPPSGGEWTLLATFTDEADVPERPATWRWTWSLPCPLPSLRSVPGLAPFDAERLARSALGSGNAQARASAALAIECMAGLAHDPGGAVAQLFALIPGLDWHMREVFDAEHREAVGWALALRAAGWRPVEVQAEEDEAPAPSKSSVEAPRVRARSPGALCDPPTVETAQASVASDGWKYPLGCDRGRRAPWAREAAVA